MEKKKTPIIREFWLAFKTRKYAPTMTVFEYFCWRIVYTRNLP